MRTDAQPYPHVSEDFKESLRSSIREARKLRSPRQRSEAGAALAHVIETIPEVASARCVSIYAARATEPDTTALLDHLAARGVRVLLPVLGTGLQRDWAEYAGSDDLLQRAPGRPPEPGTPTLGAAAIADADAVVAPALAIDSNGTRLGQGGGWYDRVLDHLRPGVRVIGVVFPEELYDAATQPLPREAHDRSVDAVATPQGWHVLRPEESSPTGTP